ncbi:unnamed protein product [Parajaminaea phylloscopi]
MSSTQRPESPTGSTLRPPSSEAPRATTPKGDTPRGTAASTTEGTAAGTTAGTTPQTTSTQTVVHTIHPDLTTFSRPFARFGIFPVGGRSTAIRLREPPNEGALWVLASTPLDQPTRERIKEMGGDVRYLVAPDVVHHLYVKEWSDAFPAAKCIGVEGLAEKQPGVQWAGFYAGEAQTQPSFGFEDEVQARYFPTFANKDVAFFHAASRSLVVADLIFNLPAKEQYLATPKGRPSSPVPFLASLARYMQPTSWFHSGFLWTAGSAAGQGAAQQRRERFARDAAAVAAWAPERIIPCHGDVVEGNGRQVWLEACKKYLTPEGRSRFEGDAGGDQ